MPPQQVNEGGLAGRLADQIEPVAHLGHKGTVGDDHISLRPLGGTEQHREGLELAALGNGMHRKYGDFKVKDYGYSTFSKFVQSISQLEVRENKINNKVVFIRQE